MLKLRPQKESGLCYIGIDTVGQAVEVVPTPGIVMTRTPKEIGACISELAALAASREGLFSGQCYEDRDDDGALRDAVFFWQWKPRGKLYVYTMAEATLMLAGAIPIPGEKEEGQS